MWVFYLISLPLTVGMVAATLRYFAGPAVPLYVLATVGYAWLCSLSFVILVPADIYTTITGNQKADVGFFWSWSYWSSFILAWVIVPTIRGYEDAGDFTVKERLKTSIRGNLLYYEIVGAIGFFGVILIMILRHDWGGAILGFAMACSNTFGLVTGAFLLGFGLSEIPKNLYYKSTQCPVFCQRRTKSNDTEISTYEIERFLTTRGETSRPRTPPIPSRLSPPNPSPVSPPIPSPPVRSTAAVRFLLCRRCLSCGCTTDCLRACKVLGRRHPGTAGGLAYGENPLAGPSLRSVCPPA